MLYSSLLYWFVLPVEIKVVSIRIKVSLKHKKKIKEKKIILTLIYTVLVITYLTQQDPNVKLVRIIAMLD